jgi:hypothetical protein
MTKHTFKVTIEVQTQTFGYEGSQLEHHKARRDAVEAVSSALKLKANPDREDSGVIAFGISHIEQID